MPCNQFKAPNGEPSVLYTALEQKFGKDEATRIWTWQTTPEFEQKYKSVSRDKNGEPLIDFVQKLLKAEKAKVIPENLPEEFTRNIRIEDSNPLQFDEKEKKKAMDAYFVQVRDNEGKHTGDYWSMEKQDAVINSMLHMLYNQVYRHPDWSVGYHRDQIKRRLGSFREEYQLIHADGEFDDEFQVTPEQAKERADYYQSVLNSFDKHGFWDFAVDKLEALNIHITKNTHPDSLDVSSEDIDEIVGNQQEGKGLRDFYDSSFEIDVKDTATPRMKMFIMSTEKSHFEDEPQPKEIKLSFSNPETRTKILAGTKQDSIRSAREAHSLGLTPLDKLPRGLSASVQKQKSEATFKVGEKLLRATATRTITDAELLKPDSWIDSKGAIHEGTVRDRINYQEGYIPKAGDIELKIEPYEQKKNILIQDKNFLGLPELADYESLWTKLIGINAGMKPNYEGYLRNMEDTTDPEIRRVVEKLQSAPGHIRKEFTSVMSNQYQEQQMILFRKSKEGNIEPRVINSNRASEIQNIVSFWKEAQKEATILTKDTKGNTVINKQLAGELFSELQSLQGKGWNKEKAVALVKKTLEANGIVLHEKALQDYVEKTSKITRRPAKPYSGDFQRQFLLTDSGPVGTMAAIIYRLQTGGGELESEEGVEGYQTGNPLYTENSAINLLARLQSRYSDKLYTHTHRNVEGKNIYSYGFNSALSHAVKALTQSEQFRKRYQSSPFAKNSWLLSKITADGRQNLFQVAYLDGIRNEYSSKAGSTRSDMSDREQWLTSLALFQGGSKDIHAHYLSLTHSDKTTTPVFLNGPRMTNLYKNVDGHWVMAPKVVQEVYHSVFMSEYNRIKQHEGEDFRIKGYNEGKKHFYFLPKFNESELKKLKDKGIITEGEYNAIWFKGTLNSVSNPMFESAAKKVIAHQLKEMVGETLKSWKDSGLLDAGLPGSKRYYKRLLGEVGIPSVQTKKGGPFVPVDPAGQPIPEEEAKKLSTSLAAADYTINSFLFNTSLSQLFYGDPALFWKGDVQKTLVEYGKRLAGPIAPGRDGEFSHSPQYTTITAADWKPAVKELSNIPGYEEVEGTDAQELTTVQEHLDVLYGYGKITDEQYQKATSRIANTDATGDYYDFKDDPVLHDLVMQPMKPVAYGMRDQVNGLMAIDYVKSSSYPLYPPVTVGMELDKLRKGMEQTGVQRVNFASAKKAGGPVKPVELFSKDGRIDDGLFNKEYSTSDPWFKDARQVLDRSEFRLQQEVPYDEDKTSVLRMSQVNWNIVQGLSQITTPFSFEGKEHTGEQIRQLKEDIVSQIVKHGHEDYLNKIGAEFDPKNETITFKDKRKLYNLLKEEALSRKGYTLNDIAAIQSFVSRSDDLTVPLMFIPSASKFESLMMSMVKKIVSYKIPGKSFIQTSPAGFRATKEFESLTPAERNRIVWTTKLQDGLKTAHLSEDGKAVQPAQLLVSEVYFKRHGINIRDYVKEGTNVLDTERVPPELFRLIGARVPTSGYASMLPIEIAGFLPEEMGDIAIVPAAITKQMGSDFDVDKLFTYNRNFSKNGDKLEPIDNLVGNSTKDRLGADEEDWEDLKSRTESKLRITGERTDEDGQYPLKVFNKYLAEAVKDKYPDGNVPKHQVASTKDTTREDEIAHLKDQYVNLHWAVLTHPEVFPTMMKPLDMPDLADQAEILSKKKEAGYYFSPNYQIADFRSMQNAKALVASTALSMDNNIRMENKTITIGKRIPVDEGDTIGWVEEIQPIMVLDSDDQPLPLTYLSGYGTSTYIDPKGNKFTRTKTDNLKIQNSESLDHAKNRTIDKLNLDSSTYPASAALSRLQTTGETAVDLRYNVGLLMQPIIREYAFDIRKQTDSLTTEFSANAQDAVYMKLYNKYAKEANLKPIESVNDLPEALSNVIELQINPKRLSEMMEKPDAAEQLGALKLFRNLDQIGRQLQTLQSLTKQDTRGAGKDILSALGTQSRRQKWGTADMEYQILNAESLFDGETGATYDATVSTAIEAYRDDLPYEKLKPMYEYLIAQTGRQEMNDEQKKAVYNAVRSYTFSTSKLGMWNDGAAERLRLLYPVGDGKSLAQRILEAKKTWGKNDYLLQRLETIIDPDNTKPDYVTYTASKVTNLDDYENNKAWLNGLTSKDPEKKKLFEDMVRYSFLTGGIQGANNFVKYIPFAYLSGTEISAALREVHSKVESFAINPSFREQYFQHNPQYAKQLSEKMKETGKEYETAPDTFTIPKYDGDTKNENVAKNLLVGKEKEKDYPDYLSYREGNKWLLYKKVARLQDGQLLYAKIDTLGDKYMDEYTEVDGGMARSAIPQNRSPWFEQIEPDRLKLSNASLDFMISAGNTERVMRQVGLLKREGNYSDIVNSLHTIAADEQQPQYLRVLADTLSKIDRLPMENSLYALLPQASKNFKYEVVPLEEKMRGRFLGLENKLQLNEKMLTKDKVAETLIHELIHYHTGLTITNEAFLPPELKEKVAALDAIRKEALEKLQNSKQKDNKNLQYALSSNVEFLSHIFTNGETISFLNDQKVEKGFLNKVKDAITSLWTSLLKAMGIRTDSLLEVSVRKGLDILTYDKAGEFNFSKSAGDLNSFYSDIRNASIQTPALDAVDKVLGKLQEQLGELKGSYTGIISDTERADKRRKIEAIEEDMEQLKKDRDMALVAEIGKKQLGWVNSTLGKEDANANQLTTAHKIADMWSGVISLLYGESAESVDPELAKVAAEAQANIHKLIHREEDYLTDLSQGFLSGQDWTTEALKDTSDIQTRLRSLHSAAASKALQYISGYVETTGRQRDEDSYRLSKELHQLETDMQKMYGSRSALQEAYKKIIRDPAGEKDDKFQMVQEYSSEWDQFKASAAYKRDTALKALVGDDPVAKSSRRKIWKLYWDEMNKNSAYVDTRKFFEPLTGEMKKDTKAVTEELEKKVGKEHAEKLITEAQDKYRKYLKDKQIHTEMLDAEVLIKEKTQEEADKEKNGFIEGHSPNIFFDNMKDGKSFRASDKHVVVAPLKEKEEFWDKKYQDIQKDKNLSDFYNRYKGIMDKLISYLPKTVQDKAGANFLPYVNRSLISETMNVPLWMRTVPQKFIRSMTATGWEEKMNARSYSKIPVEYTNPDEVSKEERSTDLIRIAEVFGQMALHYKHFSAAKDVIDMGESILKEIDRARLAGATQIEQNGRYVTAQKGLRNALDALKYLKDYSVFRKPKLLEFNTGGKVYKEKGEDFKWSDLSPIKQKAMSNRVKELIEQKTGLEQKYINQFAEDGAEPMTEQEYREQLEEIDKELRKYEGLNLYGSKIGDKLIGINQLKTLSYNPFSAVANVGFGIASVFIHANGRRDFTYKEAGGALKIMMNSWGKWASFGGIRNETSEKILNVMERMGILGDYLDSMYGKKTENRENIPGWRRRLNPFEMMRSGDYFMKGLTTVATLLHQTVDVEGKKISVWEALDGEGKWNEKKYGKRPEWFSENVSEQTAWDKLRNRVLAVNMVLHGNQDKNSPKLLNRNVLGRLIGQFRLSWLPEGWYNRYQSERYDQYLERTVKGRYRTVGDLNIGGTIHVLSRQILNLIPGVKFDPFSGTRYKMTETDIENMRRNFAELAFWTTVTGGIMMLKHYHDDKDDSRALQVLINQLIRGQQDIEFYASPQVSDAVTRDIIPASNVIKDYWNAMKASGRYIIDDDYEFNDWLLKQTKAGWPVSQATLINKSRYMMERNIDSYSK